MAETEFNVTVDCSIVTVFGPNPEWVKIWLEIRQNERLHPLGPLEAQLFESITKNFTILAQKVMAIETGAKE